MSGRRTGGRPGTFRGAGVIAVTTAGVDGRVFAGNRSRGDAGAS